MQSIRILCLRSGALGDFLVLLPALAAIRASYSKSSLHLATRPAYGKLACACGMADDVSSIDSVEWAMAFGTDGFSDAQRRWLASFDWVVNCLHDPDGVFTNHLRSANVGSMINIPGRIETGSAVEHFMAPMIDAGLILKRPATFRLRFDPAVKVVEKRTLESGNIERSSAERHADKFAAVDPPRRTTALSGSNISWRADGLSRRLVSRNGVTTRRSPSPLSLPLLALHPGSGSFLKNWPTARFAALALEFERSGEWTPLFLFGEADAEVENEIMRLAPGSRRINNLSLMELAAILSDCAAYVGNDSGVTHLAAALGLPVVALFGPSDPAIWKPCGRDVHVIKAKPDFSDLSVDRVRNALLSVNKGKNI